MRSKQISLLIKIILISLPAAWSCDPQADPSQSGFGTLKYPVARRDDNIIDTYNGTFKVPDPYQWMEKESEERTKWITDLNALSEPLLCGNSNWKKINETLTSMMAYAKHSVPYHRGNNFFTFFSVDGKKDVLYKQATAEEELKTICLDLNTLPATVNMKQGTFSPDGNWYAYGLSNSGSDWLEVKVLDTKTCKDGPQCLKQVRFTYFTWTLNNKGFFYCRYPDANTSGTSTAAAEYQKLYYHEIGLMNQERDVLVAEFPENPKWRMGATVSNDGKYLIIEVADYSSGAVGNALYYTDFDDTKPITGKLTLKPLISGFQFTYTYITNNGPKMVFQTNNKAPNGRLIVIDITNPAEDKWTNLIAEDANAPLLAAECMNKDKIVCHYSQNMKSILRVHAADSGQKIFDIPFDPATVAQMSGGYQYPEFFFRIQTFLSPGVINKVDLTKTDGKVSVVREIKTNLEGYDPNNYQVDLVNYKSKDGTEVPMYIVKNKTTTGPVPCLMYGYGGFKDGVLPSYNSVYIFFIKTYGAILALPGIRGGNEKGEDWWKQGSLKSKQNTFDDFIAAGDYLVQQKLTENKQLIIYGGSNGGLLVTACINQAPNKFGAAWARVPVTDMLRFPLFTVGSDWITEYGNPNTAEYFPILKAYSSLHNVKKPDSAETQYPYLLVTTADHDDRVPPLHTLKYLATMFNAIKDNPNQKNAILGRVYTNAGHGGGATQAEIIKQYTDFQIFVRLSLRLTAPV